MMLLGIVMALFGGMALAMAAGMFIGGPREVRAQVPPGHEVFELCKVWETTGTPGSVRTFDFEVSDSSQDPSLATDLANVVEGGPPVCRLLAAAPGIVEVRESEPAGGGFLLPSWASDNSQRNIGNVATFFLSSGGCSTALGLTLNELVTEVTGEVPRCTITFFNSDTEEPTPTSTILICKEWPSNGVLSGSRTFHFDVSDNAEQRTMPISGVVEGGSEVCEAVTVPDGQVRVTEQVPAGFDEPHLDFGGLDQSADNSITFFVSQGECSLRDPNSEQLVQAIVAASCILTFTNSDNDTATVTTTPTIVVCPRCNTVTATVPPPTSTPTPPPATATQPPPTATQPPPTATPTSITGGTGGLTDAQRTQTAVAAARTAAAQQTPLPPRTGLGSDSGGAGGVNLALFALGLLVLSGGLGIIAVRSRR